MQIVHALIAVGVNADGQREVLGIDVAGAEDGPGWLTLPRSPPGLSGVQLVVSDAHTGLVEAIAAALPARAGNDAAPSTPACPPRSPGPPNRGS